MQKSRFILLLLLIYQAVFLNIVLPGHTRGAVTIDGKHTPTACCCCCGNSQSHNEDSTFPSKRDREHCALCEFAVGLIYVPLVHLTLDELGLLEILPVMRPEVTISLDRISTYFACGPPLSPAPIVL